jgi:hypothetical protein
MIVGSVVLASVGRSPASKPAAARARVDAAAIAVCVDEASVLERDDHVDKVEA